MCGRSVVKVNIELGASKCQPASVDKVWTAVVSAITPCVCVWNHNAASVVELYDEYKHPSVQPLFQLMWSQVWCGASQCIPTTTAH